MTERRNRREFVSCAALTLGTAALASAQTAAPAATSSEVEKAVKQTQIQGTHAQARLLVRCLGPVVAKYGSGVLDLVKETSVEEGRQSAEKAPPDKRDLAGVKSLLWDRIDDPDRFAFQIVERNEKALEYRVTKCYLADAYHAAAGGDGSANQIGYATNCAWDFGFCRGLNPRIRFTRTKTLMEGHDCCNHRYELDEA